MCKRKQEPFHNTQIIDFILSVSNDISEHSFYVHLKKLVTNTVTSISLRYREISLCLFEISTDQKT